MGAAMVLTCLFFMDALAVSPKGPDRHQHEPVASAKHPYRFVTLEEHYTSRSLLPYETNPVYKLLVDAIGGSITSLLEDISGKRIESMNANDIQIQVVSNGPHPEVLDKPEVVQEANNELARAIQPFPDRFRGFCYLPMVYPELAAQELKRCVSQLNFVGALVDDHLLNKTFYDSPLYDVLWHTLEQLDVPIYLHPTFPPISEVNATGGLYAPHQESFTLGSASIIATSAWGWHSDAGMQFLRLWMAGTFDRHPKLKIVLGHMGEMLPYMLARANLTLSRAKITGIPIAEAYANNVWVTTSGYFSLDPFTTVLRTTATDRIMYSVDYPWSRNELGTEFMTALKSSGLVSGPDWENIAYRNAQKLLKLS